MGYEDLLRELRAFGTYQKKILILLCLPSISCAFHKLAGVFILAKSDHRCQLPNELSNASFGLPSDIMNMSYPFDSKLDKWSSCKMYDTDLTDAYNSSKVLVTNRSRSCDHWIYDRSSFQNTVVMEFDLVCDKAWYRGTSDSMMMAGVMMGSIIFGCLSDKVGRKTVFILSVWLQLIAGGSMVFTQDYWSFALLRILLGASTSGTYLTSYTICMEFVGPSKRITVSVITQMFFSSGFILLSAVSYVFRDWRYFQLAITMPALCFTTYTWFLPESARWLLANGKQEKAVKILKKLARENGVNMSKQHMLDLLGNEFQNESQLKVEEGPKASIFDLFKHKAILKKSMIIMMLWFVNSSTYYGLNWNTSSLGGNQHLVFILIGLVEYPACTILLLTLNRWGRKINISGFLILAGLTLLATLTVPKNDSWIVIFFAMVAKFSVTASYGALYIYTAEQFPTVVRNMGLGLGSFFARIGGIVAPCINHTGEIWFGLPMIVYGCLALLAGTGSLVLPETLNKKLPDTIEDLIVMSGKERDPTLLIESSINENADKNKNNDGRNNDQLY